MPCRIALIFSESQESTAWEKKRRDSIRWKPDLPSRLESYPWYISDYCFFRFAHVPTTVFLTRDGAAGAGVGTLHSLLM